MKKILDYQIINHGIEHPDYFQGCGVSFTEYDFCVTGIGGNERDAFEDALEQLAMADYDTTELEALVDELSTEEAIFTEDELAEMEERPFHHVSIRIR